MKIKLILIPGMILATIVVTIFLTYPAYMNDSGAAVKRAERAKQLQLTEKLDNRMNNVEKLVSDLDVQSEDNTIIFDYVSVNREEEKIIDSLNTLARDTTTILKISVTNMKKELSADPVIVGNDSLSGSDSASSTSTTSAEVSPKPELNKLSVDFSVIGKYDDIKILLSKVQKLKRFNRVVSLEIKTLEATTATGSETAQVPSDFLQVNSILEFNYLKAHGNLLSGDIENTVFSNGVFDKSVVEKIKGSRNIDMRNIFQGENGSGNPFVYIKN